MEDKTFPYTHDQPSGPLTQPKTALPTVGVCDSCCQTATFRARPKLKPTAQN